MAFEPTTIVTSAAFGALFGAGANTLLQGRSRWMETRSYATALAREVLSSGRKLASWREKIKLGQSSGGRQVEGAGIMMPPCPLTADDMLVFRSSIVGIGRLPPWLVIRVMKLYGWFRELQDEYRQPRQLEQDLARELIQRLDEILGYIDGRVFTELEVIALTPYWRKLRYEFDAWRSERTKAEYRDR